MTAHGYVEGFFGRLLSWQDRHFLLRKMAEQGLGIWVHAPKEDPLQRRRWRMLQDDAWCGEFADFCQAAGELGIRVMAAVSPGLDIDFSDSNDLRRLKEKYRQLLQCGAGSVALLFDDLLPEPKLADARMAEQQAKLAAQLLQALEVENMAFCPTQYCDAQAPSGVHRSPYLKKLAQLLPEEMPLFWTGRDVISFRLDDAATTEISELFGDRILLWDNLYACDWAPRRLSLFPYRKRGHAAPLLLNPTGMPHTDGLLLQLLGRHSRKEVADKAFKDTLKDCGVPQDILRLAPLLELYPEQPIAPDDTGTLQELLDILETLVFGDWSSPLQREWFPFLQGFRQDLRLCLALKDGRPKEHLDRLPQVLRQLVAGRFSPKA